MFFNGFRPYMDTRYVSLPDHNIYDSRPHMDFKVGVLREGLPTLVAGVLDYLVVDLVLVSVQGVLGGEDLLAEPAVQLRRFLVDRLNVGFQGLAVTVVLRERIT